MTLWSDYASPDLADVAGLGLVVQPIGAIEQHGPHLPLATDALVAQEVASHALGMTTAFSALVLPTLSYGLSSEHLHAPGTISLSPATVLAVLDDLGASLNRAGVTKLVLLNGHGGNSALLRVACRELRVRHGLMTFLVHPHMPVDQGGASRNDPEGGFAIHGGAAETSVMLHLRPDLVHVNRLERSIPDWLSQYSRIGFGGPVTFGWTAADLSATGVIGDPTLATREDGKRMFEAAVEGVVASLEEIQRFQFPN
ncbi:MAG: creatininase family protein [Ferrimicrobium sp.]